MSKIPISVDEWHSIWNQQFTIAPRLRSGIQSRKIVLFFLLGLLPVRAYTASKHWPDADLTAKQPTRRPPTVADSIGMTNLGDPEYIRGGTSRDRVAVFSPDGSRFVIVLKKGNLDQDTNEYALFQWRTSEISHSHVPEHLLTMSSSSNRGAIEDVRWMNDSETLVFLGENPNELRQLYTFNVRTRKLTTITRNPTNLLCYGMTPDGHNFAYVAKEPPRAFFDPSARRQGIVVTTELLMDLLAGRKGGDAVFGGEGQLFIKTGLDDARRLEVPGIPGSECELSMSPNGEYIVMPLRVAKIPQNWKDYADSDVHASSVKELREGEFSDLQRLEIVNAETSKNEVFLNSPIQGKETRMVWSPDGHSVAIGNVLLPLDNSESSEITTRQSKLFSVELGVPSGEITMITDEELKLLNWDKTTHRLAFEEPGIAWYDSEPGSKVFFAKAGSKWGKINGENSKAAGPEIFLKEDMNTPPKIVAIDPLTHREAMLLDLNPQFAALRFGKVEEVMWNSSDGHVVKGGLYYPVDYVSGKRYPLVIQTHFWSAKRFWIDGPWTTAFAAQALAGKSIMVLQADEDVSEIGTPNEAPREIASFEGAVDYLDQRGLVDRSRVGIIGFSRTCLHVKYALTHSAVRFAAASVTDGVDGGYFQYIQSISPSGTAYTLDSEAINGGSPFGDKLINWLERSPGFNLDKVHTPVRIVAENADVVLFEWEWFAGLSRLDKPVEMIVMQDGEHILQKPWERMISQQGNVDWFDFWLNDEEDPDPAKSAQYQRWRKMRVKSVRRQ